MKGREQVKLILLFLGLVIYFLSVMFTDNARVEILDKAQELENEIADLRMNTQNQIVELNEKIKNKASII